MCGICGVITAAPVTQDHAARTRAMNAAMTHRGPDGDGEFADRHLHLAMRRLSIIDLSGGWQPLYNEDRSLALLSNGEVYNFVELRRDLEGRGHRFRTHSDLETVLHLYEDHGLDFVHHLRGMYAIALWDSRRRRVIIVRDRMGEKPVYVHQRGAGDSREIWFSSEMRSLLSSGVVPFELDPVGIDEYLHYQWIPEPRTAVNGVRKLPAGHLLIVDVDPWRTEERCYWKMEDAPPVELARGQTPAQLIRQELDRISELVIRSDVPVGVALSGGVDSSAIAALAARKYPGTMQAFTVGYTGRPRQDERQMARELADHLKLPMHEIEVDPADMVRRFPEVVALRDDPIDDIAGHGYWAVSRAARDHGVPVLLQGQGGDELFWGYPWVRAVVGLARRKAGLDHASVLQRLRELGPRSLARNDLYHFAYDLAGSLRGWRPWGAGRNGPTDRVPFYDTHPIYQMGAYAAPRLYSDGFAAALRAAAPADGAASFFTVPRPWGDIGVLITRLITQSYLLENGIAQGDRLSMSNSVELRLPLVDYKLAELVVGLRKQYPDHDQPPKQWLKDAVSDVVPSFVMNRPKRGFSPPVAEWSESLRAAYTSDLPGGHLVSRGIVRPDTLGILCRSHGRFSPWSRMFRTVLVLEHWCRAMARAAARPAATAPVAAGSPVTTPVGATR